jgi:beta-mannosidase
LTAKRLTRWVHIVDPHYRVTLDWFHLSPRHERRIPLVGRQRNASHPPEDEVRAPNATFSIYCQRD